MNTGVGKLAESLSKHRKSAADQLSLETFGLSQETQGLSPENGGLSLREFDECVRAQFGTVCGIDEAGRGPLAGDVYAAAVILDPLRPIEGLNDSKKLSEKKREILFDEIREKALAYCIQSSSVEQIERTDILSADLDAMKRAFEGLCAQGKSAAIVIVDGDVLPPISEKNVLLKCLNKGDATSESIAAASILAKVARDRYMRAQAKIYPQYGFEKHKGYGTRAHMAAVDKYGLCPIHRKSFFKKHFAKAQNDAYQND